MAAFSDYLEAANLNHNLRGVPYVAPTDDTDVWVALYLNNPGEDATGNEVTDSGYSRQSIKQDVETLAAAWTVPNDEELEGGHYIQNTRRIQFPPIVDATITVAHFALWDAKEGGNMLYYGAFDAPKTIENGDVVSIDAGGIKIIHR